MQSSRSQPLPDRTAGRLSPRAKARLGFRILHRYLVVRRRVHRDPLPGLVAELGAVAPPRRDRYPPRRLGNAVHRTLRVGSRRPTCLVSSLVLFRLLREQGDPVELVIGLPLRPLDKEAHAWVELDRTDLGPPPGRGQNVELARYS
jgi:hypothetical protein